MSDSNEQATGAQAGPVERLVRSVPYRGEEVIYLRWEGRADDLVVRGHLPPLVAAQLLDLEYGRQYLTRMPEPYWGRWSCEPGPDGDNGRVLREYDTPGRGRFPIMVADVIAKRPL